jgi:hypothetical protein
MLSPLSTIDTGSVVTLTFLSEMSHNFRRFVADISPTEVSMSSMLIFNSFDSCDDEALVGESPALLVAAEPGFFAESIAFDVI